MAVEVLSDRALNRATLARQHLLERTPSDPVEVVEHLVGLQAQNPFDPYLALWSRVEGFDPDALGARLEDRTLVRLVVMRGTVHLVTAADGACLRTLCQPVLDAELRRHPEFAPSLVDVDLAPVMAFAHDRMAESPLNGTALRAVLGERFPDLDAAALAYACRCLLPLVQVPPRGVWGRTRQVTLAPLDTWADPPHVPPCTIDEVVLRYLAAFGPATVADVAAWSRLTGFREVVDRLRPQLREWRDERGRTVVDRPDAPRPDRDTPAPVRFLPEYDNVLLSHADRTRFGGDESRGRLAGAGPYKGAVLVDGEVRAIWRTLEDRRGGVGIVEVDHVRLPRADVRAIEAEAAAVGRFWMPAVATVDVRRTVLD